MKKILFIFAFIFSVTTYAQVDHSQWETKEFKAYVKNTLVDLITQTKAKANTCADKAVNTNVSAQTIETINKLKLTQPEATAALAYFAYKAQFACVGELPLETIGYLQFARKQGINGYDQASDPDFKTLTVLLFDQEQAIRFKYLFLAIPKDKQQALEKIEELKKPFNISVLSKIDTVK